MQYINKNKAIAGVFAAGSPLLDAIPVAAPRVPLDLAPAPSVDPGADLADLTARADAYIEAFAQAATVQAALAGLLREVEDLATLDVTASAADVALASGHRDAHAQVSADLRDALRDFDELLADPARDLNPTRWQRILKRLRAAVGMTCPPVAARLGDLTEHLSTLAGRLAVLDDASRVTAAVLGRHARRLEQHDLLLSLLADRLSRVAHTGTAAGDLLEAITRRRHDLAVHAAVIAQTRTSLAVLAEQDVTTRAQLRAVLTTTTTAAHAYRLAAGATSASNGAGVHPAARYDHTQDRPQAVDDLADAARAAREAATALADALPRKVRS